MLVLLAILGLGFVFATSPASAGPARVLEPDVLLANGLGGGDLFGDYVIRDQDSWCDFWAEAMSSLWVLNPDGTSGPPPCPVVDFRHEVVIATAGGLYPNSCYGHGIDRIERLPGRAVQVTVVTSVLDPTGGCGCLQVVTHPVVAVAVSGPIGSVEFVHEGRVNSCSLVPLEPIDPGDPFPIDPGGPIVLSPSD